MGRKNPPRENNLVKKKQKNIRPRDSFLRFQQFIVLRLKRQKHHRVLWYIFQNKSRNRSFRGKPQLTDEKIMCRFHFSPFFKSNISNSDNDNRKIFSPTLLKRNKFIFCKKKSSINLNRKTRK